MTGSLTFKQADSAWEFEQIHRLNYRTFAEEIGQYAPDGSGVLVDRFHDKNRYFIAVQDSQVVGMVAVHDQPPFSVASRMSDPAILVSLGERLLEVRLLALNAGSRHRMIFAGMLWQMYLFARRQGYSHLVISGITDKLEMYERLGFEALGPAVQTGEASFVPMAMCLQPPPERLLRDAQLYLARENRMRNIPLFSLMPGPVEIAEPVREAFCRRPISHRCPEFLEAYDRTCSRLRNLVGGMDVAPLVGSGTTGNDALSLHLAAAVEDQKGLVLTNGEFGERLIGQARRAGLNFVPLQWSWGDPWDLNRIEDNLAAGARWIWGVHLETSTGVLNDLTGLICLARRYDAKVAMDCVSSIGAAPIDSDGLFMATGVSGKALGAYAGLAFVFVQPGAMKGALPGIPSSLDVGGAIHYNGPRFTVPAPQWLALDAALELHYAAPSQVDARLEDYRRTGVWVRQQLRESGIQPLASEQHAATSITTFDVPFNGFLEKCRRNGFELAGDSGYLRVRNWSQIATMGVLDRERMSALFDLIRKHCSLAATA